MSKAIIKHICGHEEEHVLRRNYIGSKSSSPSEEWIRERLEGDYCSNCKKEREEKRREEEYKNALEYEKEHNLPKLLGSEKQIKYATVLRYKFASRKINDDMCDLIRDEVSRKLYAKKRRGGAVRRSSITYTAEESKILADNAIFEEIRSEIINNVVYAKDYIESLANLDHSSILRNELFNILKLSDEISILDKTKYLINPIDKFYDYKYILFNIENNVLVIESFYNQTLIEYFKENDCRWNSDRRTWNLSLEHADAKTKVSMFAIGLLDIGFRIFIKDDEIAKYIKSLYK